MKKLTVSIIAILVLVLTVLSPVSAAQPDGLQWDNTNLVSASIGFYSGIGDAEALVIGKPDTTQTKIDVVVYKQTTSGWTYVNEAHASRMAQNCGIECDFDAVYNGYYKADFTFTVTRYGVDEIIYRTEYQLYDSNWD